MEKRLKDILACIDERRCDLYIVDVVMIVTPPQDDLYDVHIYTNGLNYTRGSIYSDTVTRRVVVSQLSYYISMISYGITRGYEEWLDVEKRLGTHLDVGYGLYDSSRDGLSVHIDLPAFKFCEIAHACGEFYVNTTLYIDSEKYVIWQFMELNFSYLIDKGYIKIRKVENGYAYPINPPAVMRFTYIESPFWRIPTELLNSTRIPIVITLHIATTNSSILEKYLDQLEIFRPLIEASLTRSYISEVTCENLTKYVELLDQVNSKAIQKFLEYLHNKVVERLYPGTLIEIKYVENVHGRNYYLVKWKSTELLAYMGTLEIHMHDATQKLIERLTNATTKMLR